MDDKQNESTTEDRIRELHKRGFGRDRIIQELGATAWAVRKALAGAPTLAPTPVVIDPASPTLRADVVRKLRQAWRNVGRLAVDSRVSEGSLRELIENLSDRGYGVEWDGESRVRIRRHMQTSGGAHVDHCPIEDGWHRFGVISDTHLGSEKERLDVLESAYDRFAELGLACVYHCGNLLDGEGPHNRYDLKVSGLTDQVLYALDHYPQRPGLMTWFITGDCHEGWWRRDTGIEIGRYIQFEARDRGRNDLIYAGRLEADFELRGKNKKAGGCSVKVFHPGSGSTYALSYTTQKLVESFEGGEKPSILLVGHFHKALAHEVRNVFVIQAGCCQDQTFWMRKKRIEAHVGYWVVEAQLDSNGALRRVRPEWTRFYNRRYHAVQGSEA